MKNFLSFSMLTLLTLCFFKMSLKATDLVVAAGGAGGTYASIGAALTAASPGDRIIVYPQAGGASYSEGTLNITKSIQILSANEGAYYSVDGTINISPTTAGSSITIIGMKLFTGNILSTLTAPVGNRCVVNLLNDSLAQGYISINHDNYNVTAAANYIDGGLIFKFGKAIGNICNAGISVNHDASVNNPTDTTMIIGNRITVYSGTSTYGCINWSSSAQYFSIQNNFCLLTYPANGYGIGVYVTNSKNNASGVNTVFNNTVHKPAYTMYSAYTFSTSANAMTEIQNNLAIGTTSYYSYYTSGGTFSVHYNFSNNPNNLGFTNDGTNITATNTTLNSVGLNTNALSNTINGGNPDSAYADINLTRNDVGCYGGSFTQDNFFPFTANDWARVILVTAPRRILVNGTINVKALGFDK
ncbi:MAG: hypothetical protein JNJ58_11995 [Chitinophagaceae bacterium]|nr:hypothetical protein [Chitinophagaceae bacterium]